MLYIVSTPIGNLEDITLRAIRILKEVSFIAAEDTRHVQILLQKYEITTPVLSFHSYSGDFKLEKIIDILKNGKDVALVSDAGTPGISDPGYPLIRRAIDEKITVSAIPGPSSLLAGVVSSGLPMDKFLYLGFLPIKKGRHTLLESLSEEHRTIVMFEAPHRLARTLSELDAVFGYDRPIALCKELTKKFETIFRGTISSVTAEMQGKSIKGEWVIIVGGASRGAEEN